MRYDLSDYEWGIIKPMLPNKPRGIPRMDDRRVLNGIFWVLRSGRPPGATCLKPPTIVGWPRADVWDGIIEALAAAHDATAQIIDTSIAQAPCRWRETLIQSAS